MKAHLVCPLKLFPITDSCQESSLGMAKLMMVMMIMMAMLMMEADLVWRLSGIVEPLLVGPAEEQHASTAVLFDGDYEDEDDNDKDDDDQGT